MEFHLRYSVTDRIVDDYCDRCVRANRWAFQNNILTLWISDMCRRRPLRLRSPVLGTTALLHSPHGGPPGGRPRPTARPATPRSSQHHPGTPSGAGLTMGLAHITTRPENACTHVALPMKLHKGSRKCLQLIHLLFASAFCVCFSRLLFASAFRVCFSRQPCARHDTRRI